MHHPATQKVVIQVLSMVQKQFYSISRQHPKSLPQSIRHHYIDNLLVWRHSRRKEIFYACLGLRDI